VAYTHCCVAIATTITMSDGMCYSWRLWVLLIVWADPATPIRMAAEQQLVRLPCQRCLRRLSRPRDVDGEEPITCKKQAGHVLCDYCASIRKPCLDVGLRVLRSVCCSHT